MKAITAEPGKAGTVRCEDFPEPDIREGSILVEAIAVAVVSLGGVEVHVLDRNKTGPKPELVRALGATHHSGSVLDLGFEPDVIVECAGVGSVIADSIQKVGEGGVVCLTGAGSGGITSRGTWNVSSVIATIPRGLANRRTKEKKSLELG